MKRKYLILMISMILVMSLSLGIGATRTSMKDVLEAFLSPTLTHTSIIVRSRVPRTIGGLLAGCSLALSGLLMQCLTRNDCADGTVLGVNSGASLAVISAMICLGISAHQAYLFFAFIGGLLAFFCVYVLAHSGGRLTPTKMILSGAALSMILSSLISAIILPNIQTMERFRFWQLGSLGAMTMSDLMILGPVLVLAIGISFFLIRPLRLFMLGDEMAVSLGVNVPLITTIAAFCSILLVSCVTALCGPIGFIGLMVPHMIKIIGIHDLKHQMVLSMMLGGILLVISDIFARVLGNVEVGVITALIGAPVFILMLRRSTHA